MTEIGRQCEAADGMGVSEVKLRKVVSDRIYLPIRIRQEIRPRWASVVPDLTHSQMLGCLDVVGGGEV